ncbi:hypothetical protein RA275_29475, partial [Pseudomonas syringae pv. tagetis]
AAASLQLVKQQQRRDPALWSRLIEHNRITQWKSVPAMLDMLLTYTEGFGQHTPASITQVMLSGDRICMDLTER